MAGVAVLDLERGMGDREALVQRLARLSRKLSSVPAPGRTRCTVSAVSVVLIAQICTSCTSLTPGQSGEECFDRLAVYSRRHRVESHVQRIPEELPGTDGDD